MGPKFNLHNVNVLHNTIIGTSSNIARPALPGERRIICLRHGHPKNRREKTAVKLEFGNEAKLGLKKSNGPSQELFKLIGEPIIQILQGTVPPYASQIADVTDQETIIYFV